MWLRTTGMIVFVAILNRSCDGVQIFSRNIWHWDSAAVDQGYQFYTLSYQWPQSACVLHRDRQAHSERQCDIHANVTAWGIHGLWPSDYRGPEPAYCDGGPFDIGQLYSLLPQLLQRWPNVYAEQTAADFWSHEWEKHGTCALAAAAVKSQLDYFSKALSLGNTLSLLTVLAQADILPDSEQPISVRHVADTLASRLQRHFVIVCQHDMERQQYLLTEVHVCFDNNWQPTYCYHQPSASGDVNPQPYQLHGCDRDEVYYLPIEHTPAPL